MQGVLTPHGTKDLKKDEQVYDKMSKLKSSIKEFDSKCRPELDLISKMLNVHNESLAPREQGVAEGSNAVIATNVVPKAKAKGSGSRTMSSTGPMPPVRICPRTISQPNSFSTRQTSKTQLPQKMIPSPTKRRKPNSPTT